MSSPTPSNDGDASKSNLEQITFRFCSECSNMLYPKEDEDAHKLQFTCRTCQYTEEATSSCVFRNVMNNAAGETAGVTQDVGSDPTVRTDAPPAPSSAAQFPPPPSADGNLAVCLRCGVTLLHCDRCKDPASVEEYNQFVARNPNFAKTRTMGSLQCASYWNTQDDKEKAAWDDRFASFDGLPISNPPEKTLTDYMRMGMSFMNMETDEDPPETFDNPDDVPRPYDNWVPSAD
ncbi:histone lysine methyltransferase Set9 [Hypoxylon texense]